MNNYKALKNAVYNNKTSQETHLTILFFKYCAKFHRTFQSLKLWRKGTQLNEKKAEKNSKQFCRNGYFDRIISLKYFCNGTFMKKILIHHGNKTSSFSRKDKVK